MFYVFLCTTSIYAFEILFRKQPIRAMCVCVCAATSLYTHIPYTTLKISGGGCMEEDGWMDGIRIKRTIRWYLKLGIKLKISDASIRIVYIGIEIEILHIHSRACEIPFNQYIGIYVCMCVVSVYTTTYISDLYFDYSHAMHNFIYIYIRLCTNRPQYHLPLFWICRQQHFSSV